MVSGQACPLPWSWVTHGMEILQLWNEIIHQLPEHPLLLPKVFFHFPRSLLEQTRIIFGSDPSCQVHCHLQFTGWHTRGSYWSLVPSGQLFWDVCAWHSQGLPADSPSSWAPIVLSQGSSAACFYAPNQRATSSDLIVSQADWTGKQLWAKFNHSHFRKWDAERFWEWNLGTFFVFPFIFIFWYLNQLTELNPGGVFLISCVILGKRLYYYLP